MIASVSGMRILMVVPQPTVLVRSTLPPMRSIEVRTTSIPTPRPETLVTCSAVEKPGRKIRSRTSRGSIRASCSRVTTPRRTATSPMCRGSMPLPSSVISTTT